MKKVTLVLFMFLLLQYGECEWSWYPSKLVDTVKSRSTQLKDYVQEKGRSFRDLFVGDKNNSTRSVRKYYEADERQENMERKFEDYINAALKDNAKISDAVKKDYSCKDDPSVHMSTPQLIAMHGYSAESHTIITDDGYILTLHRIPGPRDTAKLLKGTVLLHHGLLGSSADWVLTGPGHSLAYILSDAGYDVWMANVRGNTYSRAHVSKSVDTYEFWNFTFHDVSQHDLPAVIDYITNLKGGDAKINYVGHSMGTTALFALLSTKTRYNKILRAGYALAPVAFMTDIRSPLRILSRFADNIEYLLKILGEGEFLPQNYVIKWLSKYACEINHYEEVICENSLFVLCGHDEKQFNRTLLPIILGHVPAGASTRTLVHYAQEIYNKGRFQQFDYGQEGNRRQYGTDSPPEYGLRNITLPIALFGAENDWLASEVDVSKLYTELANPIEYYKVPMKEFNHIDFLWAVDAPKLVYAKLLQVLEVNVDKMQISNDIQTHL